MDGQHQPQHVGPSTVPLGSPTEGMEGELGPAVCNACHQSLDETTDNTVVSFGKYLFHVECFRCAKCNNLVEHSTNLLLLSDGSPVCENCSYICSVCEKPIHNEAIVTGDESYHADCFRCRSCSNKIEELIFAKTQQGIWCMACHNERVARTRKHAEAKRNRQARKDKEAGGTAGRSREHRERDRDREKRDRTGEFSVDSTSTLDAPHPPPMVRPLPPSPSPYPRSASFDTSATPSSSSIPHQRAQTSPGDAPRHAPSPPAPASYGLAPSASSQSISALSHGSGGRPTTPLTHAPALTAHSRTSSQMSHDGASGGERRTSASQLRQEINASSRRPSGESTRGGEQRDFQPYPLPHQASDGPLSPTLAEYTAQGSRNGSLSAPGAEVGSKAANRRSGFYGAGAAGSRPSLGEEGIMASLREGAGEGEPASRSTTPPLVAGGGPSVPRSGSTSELHGSMSFYDPDTLLFLNGVGSAPNSPKLSGSSAAHSRSGSVTGTGAGAGPTDKALPDLTLLPPSRHGHGFDDDESAMERLSLAPSPGPQDISGSEGEGDAYGDGGESDVGIPGGRSVARKVRESLHLAKRESKEGEQAPPGALDVELVEMLLKELEDTKREMKDIKGKYNAFRRASRSAFEGFSMAREEYDKEVAARRDAEHRMALLQHKFLEQAKRLAQVDQEQKTAESLKRQSKDLRNSVVGMEKHLSQLKTEVALSTAHVAELAALGKEDTKTPDRTSVPAAVQNEVAEALDARLEAIKDAHRDEVNALIAQRDDLLREVAELKQTRDAFLEETNDLSTRNASLVEKNADATRQLDQLNESLSKMQLMSSKTGTVGLNGRPPHAHTASSSSLSSSLPSYPASAAGSRSPLATARVIGSPSDLTDSFRFAKPEQVEVHTASRSKGFKWGKSSSKSNADAANKANQQLPPVPPGAKSPVPPRTGSVDNGTGVRQHYFQQTSILRPVRCDYCGDKMWGLNEVRCGACGSYAHAKCAGYLSNGCHPGGHGGSSTQDDTLNFTPTGPPIFGNDLVAQAVAEQKEVPVVVSKCIEAVEAYGMTYEGVYRKTGGMGQTKLITQYFERGADFDLLDRDKFNDLAAITSCMKNYFRSLPVPLFTHDLHEEFVAAAELPDSEGRIAAIERVLYKLPPVHFHTARLLFRHLNRVKSLSAENKMTSANLGVVFGPTVLRSPVAAREWSDMGPKAKMVEILCDHAESLFSKPYPPA
ncbi:hypothetical protein JCM10207_007771 [Rhodosporidiobolus poonsookiae]